MRRPAIICLLMSALAQLAAGDGPLADLDLTTATGVAVTAPGLTYSDVTWTPDGLFLPAAVIPRIPRAYPMNGDDYPAPNAPYRADLVLPGFNGRRVTVTLVVSLAAMTKDQDNLFSLGRRSRWLSAQVGSDGQIIVGLDNRWLLLKANGANAPPSLADHAWHVVSVGLGDNRAVCLAVDGVVADLTPAPDTARFPPRPLADDAPVLSFADPGSARHLNGLVRRVIVHSGLLDRQAIIALHRTLDPMALPQPHAAVFLQALVSAPEAPVKVDPEAPPGVNNF